jgi:hypothetical protein
MDSKNVPRRILYHTVGGKRPVGKRKRRWIAAVRRIRIRYWV